MSEAPTPAPSARRSARLAGCSFPPAFRGLAGRPSIYYAVGRTTIPQASAELPTPPPAPDDPPAPKPRRLHPAPELDGGVAWLNTAAPIHLNDLRGKIVVLDFWTYCCINCMHMLPDLAKLEKKYANRDRRHRRPLGQVRQRKDSDNIRRAVLPYEVAHPVVNDAHMTIWNNYEVSSWPTLVLIDPDGNLVARGSGEGLYEALDVNIQRLIKEFREKKTLNEKPLHFEPARSTETVASPLFFPGKVLFHEAGKRLFISDSTHHRIVITDLGGKKVAVAGEGQAGAHDGAFDKARFNDPQGLALDGDTLYVADRKNNRICALDLKAKTVTTVAGTGDQGDDREYDGPALKAGLNSPWDLLMDVLPALRRHGRLPSVRGRWTSPRGPSPLTPGRAWRTSATAIPGVGRLFAQPSGLATDGKTLFVADSEVSAIRAVPLGG